MTTYGEDGLGTAENADFNGQHRLDHIVNMYREMNIPFGPMMAALNRKTKQGRDIIWARGDFTPENFDNVVVPTLMDFDYLKSLAPNTVGAHYYNLVKDWGIEEIYNQRFKYEEIQDDNFAHEMRVNLSRHLFLAHDFWHCIFRYDTSPLGEACIQALTHQFSKNTGPWYMSYLMALKEKNETGTWEAFKVIREAHRLGKQAKRAFYTLNYDELLEMDIEDVRTKYNIGAPVEFYKYAEKYPSNFRFDSIHPEYQDTKITYTEATI